MKRILTLLLLLAVVGGCKSGSKPQSDLDKFVTEMRRLPPAEALTTLQGMTSRPAPQSTYAKYELGNIYFRKAEDAAEAKGWNDDGAKAWLDSSQTWFEAAVAADSTFVEAWVNLGGIWDNRADMMAPMTERQARTAKASSMYQKALTIDPRDAKARCNLGALYMRDRKTEDAKREFTTVLQQDPQSALAHYHMAVLFAEARIYREAELEWKLAVKYDPDGDIGERSKANLKILEDLQKAPTPAAAKP
jgi:tetratricopeptide (TPR) repeat protein